MGEMKEPNTAAMNWANKPSDPFGRDRNDDRWVDAVFQLIRLTQTGAAIWRPVDQDDPRYPISYVSDFDGHVIRLDRVEEINFAGFLGSLGLTPWIPSTSSRRGDTDVGGIGGIGIGGISLRVFKPDGSLLMRFPDIPPLRGLVDAIEAQNAGEADAFLQKLASS